MSATTDCVINVGANSGKLKSTKHSEVRINPGACKNNSSTNISAADEASKCFAKGTGLHRAELFKTTKFVVDASKAKHGSIMVGMHGSANPSKEIVVKHIGNQVYSVEYTLEESGDYKLHVLWSGIDIPGSPFFVRA